MCAYARVYISLFIRFDRMDSNIVIVSFARSRDVLMCVCAYTSAHRQRFQCVVCLFVACSFSFASESPASLSLVYSALVCNATTITARCSTAFMRKILCTEFVLSLVSMVSLLLVHLGCFGGDGEKGMPSMNVDVDAVLVLCICSSLSGVIC